MKKWILKSVCNGYIIGIYDADGDKLTQIKFDKMWDAINYMNGEGI